VEEIAPRIMTVYKIVFADPTQRNPALMSSGVYVGPGKPGVIYVPGVRAFPVKGLEDTPLFAFDNMGQTKSWLSSTANQVWIAGAEVYLKDLAFAAGYAHFHEIANFWNDPHVVARYLSHPGIVGCKWITLHEKVLSWSF
jgi:hypothetical protein